MAIRVSTTTIPTHLKIDIKQPGETLKWAKKFNVSDELLRRAVEAVGSYAEDVEAFLQVADRNTRRL